MPLYIDVIVPISVENLFTYALSQEESTRVQPGMRLAVPFGKSKIYTAIVYRIHETPPPFYEAKPIHAILDEKPLVTQQQLKHWFWMANYYMCTIGEVCRAAIPGALLLSSETLILKAEVASTENLLKGEDEQQLYHALQHHSVLSVQEASRLVQKKNVLPLLERLLKKNLIRLKEEIIETYRPKLIRHIRLHTRFASDSALHELITQVEKAPKQREALLSLLTLEAAKKPVKIAELKKKAAISDAVIRTLLNKEIMEEYTLPTDRVQFSETETENAKLLSPAQQEALHQVREKLQTHATVLLHGITASGKTELYATLMEEALVKEPHRQILYLLPEIALTQQLIERLRRYFGNRISVYHSNYSINERVEVWYHCLNQLPKATIVLGTRSAIFLPFSDLGLVVVDEEHETSFKQADPAPRYHARDSALVLASMHRARVLLGSATPAVESYHNAEHGKYGLVTLSERYGAVQSPQITLVNLGEAYRKRRMKGHFSDTLVTAIQGALDAGEQVILFQNRRGYAPAVSCRVCGHAPQCANCDITLTYHRQANQLRCHYCGYHMALQETCLACGSPDLDTKGFGTEQVEAELKELFPAIPVGRMDGDTTRGKFAYERILSDFEQQEIRILVGTQMLAKGLDFERVSLVGIMNADSLLHFPDFRAHERAFQRMLQVAGRAGRRNKQGNVLIQTYQPQHPVLQQVLAHDYLAMYETQCEERRHYQYPPFYRLIRITLQHADYDKLNEGSRWLATSLRNSLGDKVLGPEFPPVARVKNKYLKNILIKIPQDQGVNVTKQVLKRIAVSFHSIAAYRSVRIIFNVDPY